MLCILCMGYMSARVLGTKRQTLARSEKRRKLIQPKPIGYCDSRQIRINGKALQVSSYLSLRTAYACQASLGVLPL